MNGFFFLVFYLLFMVPTYLLRYAYFSLALTDESIIADEASMELHILLVLFYLVMAGVTYMRGKTVGKPYLVAFPIVGGFFDVVLPIVILVPTVMNIITIVLAMIPQQKK